MSTLRSMRKKIYSLSSVNGYIEDVDRVDILLHEDRRQILEQLLEAKIKGGDGFEGEAKKILERLGRDFTDDERRVYLEQNIKDGDLEGARKYARTLNRQLTKEELEYILNVHIDTPLSLRWIKKTLSALGRDLTDGERETLAKRYMNDSDFKEFLEAISFYREPTTAELRHMIEAGLEASVGRLDDMTNIIAYLPKDERQKWYLRLRDVVVQRKEYRLLHSIFKCLGGADRRYLEENIERCINELNYRGALVFVEHLPLRYGKKWFRKILGELLKCGSVEWAIETSKKLGRVLTPREMFRALRTAFENKDINNMRVGLVCLSEPDRTKAYLNLFRFGHRLRSTTNVAGLDHIMITRSMEDLTNMMLSKNEWGLVAYT